MWIIFPIFALLSGIKRLKFASYYQDKMILYNTKHTYAIWIDISCDNNPVENRERKFLITNCTLRHLSKLNS